MTDLTELASRVEALDGPCRETELAIWRIVDPRAPEAEALGRVPLPWLNCYTASLDSAMTLVPEGWHTFMATQDRHTLRWGWYLRGGYGFKRRSYAATPALALTAAALRARAAMGEG